MISFLLAAIIAVDGDTLQIYKQRYRLQSIDSPELHQTCQLNGKDYNCGEEAKAHLESLIKGKEVHCEDSGYRSYNRIVATCYANGEDLGEEQVRSGNAVGYFGNRYHSQELIAKLNKRGLWASKFITPQHWRREHE